MPCSIGGKRQEIPSIGENLPATRRERVSALGFVCADFVSAGTLTHDLRRHERGAHQISGLTYCQDTHSRLRTRQPSAMGLLTRGETPLLWEYRAGDIRTFDDYSEDVWSCHGTTANLAARVRTYHSACKASLVCCRRVSSGTKHGLRRAISGCPDKVS